MYKKILLSLALLGSIIISPVAQAKGTPVIGPVVESVTKIVEQIPLAGPVIVDSWNVIADITNTAVDLTVKAVDKLIVEPALTVVNILDTFVITPLECVGALPGGCVPGKTTTPSSLSAPSKPLNVQVSNKYNDGSYINHGFRVYWDAPSSLGGASSVSYRIYRGTSASSLSTLITTTEMSNGQREFLENRIQDPTKPFYYKVIACNSAKCGDGDVVMSPTDIQYLTNAMTLTGAGFSKDTKVSLVNDGKSVACSGFTASDSRTLTGGTCNITDAPTGVWTVRIQNLDGKMSECKGCFKIALPEPVSPSIIISKKDLSDGKFSVVSVAGDNLYTGATVQIAAKGNTFDCFSLSSFDYQSNKFAGGECDISGFLKTLGFSSDSDIIKLSVQIVNDVNSVPVIPSGIPSFTCTSSSYTNTYNKDISQICGTSPIEQISNCGVVVSSNPGLTCISGQTCTNGACVGCAKKTTQEACGVKVCGSVSDGCNGTISCGTCSSGYICNTSGTCDKAFQ